MNNHNNWTTSWQELELAGANIGIDHIINPQLYSMLVDTLAQSTQPLTLHDFGAGTSSLAFDLLIKEPKTVPGFALVDPNEIIRARQNVESYIGYEQKPTLVREAQDRFKKFHLTERFQSIEKTIPFQNVPHATNSLAISRNFLMHLSIPDLEQHLQQVHQLVGPNGYYILSMLNPDYEQQKHGDTLQDGETYNFKHGQHGELGLLTHYFKTRQTYEAIFNKYFTIKHITICTPMTDDFLDSHARYYSPFVPLAYVYCLRAK